jgi:hypothetical protein
MSALPHLAPVHGVREPAKFTNLTICHPPIKGAAARKAAAAMELKSEVAIKRSIDKTNRVLDALEARDAALALAVKQLQRRRADNAARVLRIEDAALTLMQDAGVTAVTGFHSGLRSQLTPASLEIVSPALIPRQFLRQPKTPPPEPDKTAIKKALAENENLDAAAWGRKLTARLTLKRT